MAAPPGPPKELMPPQAVMGPAYGSPEWKATQTQMGIMDGQKDWGPMRGGGIFECCNWAPCCSPKCCCWWYCAPALAECQMFAWSLDQDCSLINHLIPIYYGNYYMMPFVRHAMRNKLGVIAGGPCEGLLGDCLCIYCCAPCGKCQELRGAHTMGGEASWDCLLACQEKRCGCYTGPCKSFPPFCPPDKQ